MDSFRSGGPKHEPWAFEQFADTHPYSNTRTYMHAKARVSTHRHSHDDAIRVAFEKLIRKIPSVNECINA